MSPAALRDFLAVSVIIDAHDCVYEFVVLAVRFRKVRRVLQCCQVHIEMRRVHYVGQTMQRGRLKLSAPVTVPVRLLLDWLELLRLQTNMVHALFSAGKKYIDVSEVQKKKLYLKAVIMRREYSPSRLKTQVVLVHISLDDLEQLLSLERRGPPFRLSGFQTRFLIDQIVLPNK